MRFEELTEGREWIVEGEQQLYDHDAEYKVGDKELNKSRYMYRLEIRSI